MNEAAIRAGVRAMVENGALPCNQPDHRLWARLGAGRYCAACGQPISPTEVEYEVDVAATILRLHPLCHRFWKECAPPKRR